MSRMFESTEINGMKMANRFVRSATWEGLADGKGAVTPRLLAMISELALGDIGLIISSHAYVREDGKAGPGQIGIHKDELIQGLKGMTRVVHDQGGKIICQMTHAGFFANPKLTGRPILAPSDVEGFAKSPRQQMTEAEIGAIIEAFGEAARRAREAGFDGVQIHAAHSYLFSQFVSPAFNKRTDRYGGSVKNRARALLEALGKIREVAGGGFPILVKLNCADFMEGGLTLEDSVRVGILLQQEGIDAIEVSGGTLVSGKLGPSRVGIGSGEREAYFREEGKAFKETLDVPIILVGGNRSFGMAERLVEEGCADYISMSRPLIREPGLVKRWKAGDLRKAACVSDNLCFRPGMAGKGVYCLTEEKEKNKK
jgi:2,4-dienoyl-CoA reductase-like NADH-dependent reductase (Old Yellow Enzyme family)